MKCTPQPGKRPAPPQHHVPRRVQKPPDPAVQTVQQAIAGDVAAAAPEAFDNADDLVGADAALVYKLMISPQSIGAV